NKKIETANAKEAKEKAEKEKQAAKRSSSSRRSSSGRRRSSRSALEKVLTSPTVIRSVLGILTKMIK
ncbi:MAG: ATPase, partial [Bacteroidetes bacterium]|nr:ATPase [Bacteroidota bacterium]